MANLRYGDEGEYHRVLNSDPCYRQEDLADSDSVVEGQHMDVEVIREPDIRLEENDDGESSQEDDSHGEEDQEKDAIPDLAREGATKDLARKDATQNLPRKDATQDLTEKDATQNFAEGVLSKQNDYTMTDALTERETMMSRSFAFSQSVLGRVKNFVEQNMRGSSHTNHEIPGSLGFYPQSNVDPQAQIRPRPSKYHSQSHWDSYFQYCIESIF